MIHCNDYTIERIEKEIVAEYDRFPVDYPEHRYLLKLRKDLLNRQALALQSELLPDIIAFNDALRNALHSMYKHTHQVWNDLAGLHYENFEVTARCYLGSDYPTLHINLTSRVWKEYLHLSISPSAIWGRILELSQKGRQKITV